MAQVLLLPRQTRPKRGTAQPEAGVKPFPIVGLGASAGGLEAFTLLLKNLAVDTGMGFVLVQHLDPEHESALVTILSRTTTMPVLEITEGKRVEPNQILVIPRDASLTIESGSLHLQPRQSGRTPHRTIDTFFESLANDQRERAIGVVLSGTASDGTLGLEAIKAEGGITFAQDASAKHGSMPRSAVAAGVVDFVLSPAEIARELARIATHPFVKGEPFLLAPTRRALPREKPVAPQRIKEPDGAGVAELENDLNETRAYLQSMQEQHEAATEELQAANEEVQSANEELQSINEELETSKEELESANEELTTVNEEMGHRNIELNRLNSDLVNLQASTRLAILLVGRDLTIRRFSLQAEKMFDLLAGDIGRPLGHLRHSFFQIGEGVEESRLELEEIVGEVIANVREEEREVRDSSGLGQRWYSLRVRPYLTLDNRVDGAVLVLVDISGIKRGEQAIAAARDYSMSIVNTVRNPMLVLDANLRVETANYSYFQDFRASPAVTMGRSLFDLGNGQWDLPQLREQLGQIFRARPRGGD